MRYRSLLPFAVLPLVFASLGGGLAACFAVSDGMNGGSGFGEGGGPGASVGPGVGGSGGGGFNEGGGVGEFPGAPPPDDPAVPPVGGLDGGADADPEFTCAGIDDSKPVVLYLSADDSNSMGSPVHVRELIGIGIEPMAQEIRTYEFLNYYRIAYDAPATGKLSLVPELGSTAVAGDFDFQIAVRAFDAVKPRRPMTVTFVLDISGSMSGPGIERERAAVKAIAANLAEGTSSMPSRGTRATTS